MKIEPQTGNDLTTILDVHEEVVEIFIRPLAYGALAFADLGLDIFARNHLPNAQVEIGRAVA